MRAFPELKFATCKVREPAQDGDDSLLLFESCNCESSYDSILNMQQFGKCVMDTSPSSRLSQVICQFSATNLAEDCKENQ